MTREEWLNAFTNAARPIFAEHGFTLPENIAASIGFPSTGARGRRIGECWSESASADGRFAIFLHPGLKTVEEIAATHTHELVHAAVGLEAKHGPKFKRCATKLGLVGKMTATSAGPDWRAWAVPVMEKIGPWPHGALAAGSNGRKKQPTRLLKCECAECGFLFRATEKWTEGRELRCPDPECDGLVAVG